MQTEKAPALGGDRWTVDAQVWGQLLGENDRSRNKTATQLRDSGLAHRYADRLLESLPRMRRDQRLYAGYALALLGDPRFSKPYYLSEMLVVPKGAVIIGSDMHPSEQPVHRVEVGEFSLAQYPTTCAAYASFVESTGYQAPRGWKRKRPPEKLVNAPVVFVSGYDAEQYCAWLSSETGHQYRLPTEAEWMLAARGPETSRVYPWGETHYSNCANLWHAEAFERLCAVGLFPDGEGPFGHADLCGNVWEWCSSLDWPYPYRADDGREFTQTEDARRVMHGGSWRSKPEAARSAVRQGERASDSFKVVGFRIARDG